METPNVVESKIEAELPALKRQKTDEASNVPPPALTREDRKKLCEDFEALDKEEDDLLRESASILESLNKPTKMDVYTQEQNFDLSLPSDEETDSDTESQKAFDEELDCLEEEATGFLETFKDLTDNITIICTLKTVLAQIQVMQTRRIYKSFAESDIGSAILAELCGVLTKAGANPNSALHLEIMEFLPVFQLWLDLNHLLKSFRQDSAYSEHKPQDEENLKDLIYRYSMFLADSLNAINENLN